MKDFIAYSSSYKILYVMLGIHIVLAPISLINLWHKTFRHLLVVAHSRFSVPWRWNVFTKVSIIELDTLMIDSYNLIKF